MKRIFTFILVLLALTGCTSLRVQSSDSAGSDSPQANIPNPASVYCEQQGNTLEIQTTADGSQSGLCIFADGSTCDEWAHFRGECVVTGKETDEATTEASGGYMEPGTSEEFADWWGVIKSTAAGAQYDDYFERQDLGLEYINFGIDSMDVDVKVQIEALCDTGKIVHLYGTLFSNVPDYNGSQVLIDRIEVEGN